MEVVGHQGHDRDDGQASEATKVTVSTSPSVRARRCGAHRPSPARAPLTPARLRGTAAGTLRREGT